MDIEKIKEKVAYIDSIKNDDEAAHSIEDQLRHDFILYIANFGPKDLSEMAREILKTEEIDFRKWCA